MGSFTLLAVRGDITAQARLGGLIILVGLAVLFVAAAMFLRVARSRRRNVNSKAWAADAGLASLPNPNEARQQDPFGWGQSVPEGERTQPAIDHSWFATGDENQSWGGQQ